VHVTIDRAGAVKDARVVEGHPMLRAAAVNAAQQCEFEEDAAQERVATLKISLATLPANSKVQAQTVFLPPVGVEIRQKPVEPAKPAAGEQSGGERPAPRAISKTWTVLRDVSVGILRAQTTRCSG
jgi:hypothetical protein